MGGLGPPRGPLWSLWGNLSKMGAIFPQNASPFGHPFGTQIHQNPQKVVKSGCPESSQEKSRHRTSPGVAQCGIHTVTAICLERSSLVHLGGFWVTFGYLLGSLLVTLGSQWPFWGLKKRSQKSDQKKVQKGHAGLMQEFSPGECAALKEYPPDHSRSPGDHSQETQKPRGQK